MNSITKLLGVLLNLHSAARRRLMGVGIAEGNTHFARKVILDQAGTAMSDRVITKPQSAPATARRMAGQALKRYARTADHRRPSLFFGGPWNFSSIG